MKFVSKLRKKHYIQCFLSIFLMSVFLYILFPLWTTREITVSFDAEQQKNVEYQFFYTEHISESFNESQSVKRVVSAPKKHITIKLPIKKIIKLRIDFGSKPQRIILSNLLIKGNKRVELNDFSLFTVNQVDKISERNDVFELYSDQNDPYVICQNDLNLKGKIVIDWNMLIILSTVLFLLLYKIVHYLARFKLEQNHSRIDIVFLTVFFSLLFVPMLHISDAEKSEKENRVLAKFPQINNAFSDKINFGEQFDKWFNDRFFGRNFLISLHNMFNKIQNIEETDKVLVGEDYWMFYKRDNGYYNFANKSVFSESDMQKGLEYLKAIDNWCIENGKEFYYIIAPDKSKIYGEYYRLINKVAPDSYGIGYQFINYIHQHSTINAIYLRDDLLKQKNEGLLYYKNDTHWNFLGGYYGYKSLMNLMKRNAIEASFEKTDLHELGDLTRMYRKIGEPIFYKNPVFKENIECLGRDIEPIKCTDKKMKESIYVLRDSFATSLIPYLSRTFKESNYLWRYNITTEDLSYIKENSDIIILENVERFIPQIFKQEFPKD